MSEYPISSAIMMTMLGGEASSAWQPNSRIRGRSRMGSLLFKVRSSRFKAGFNVQGWVQRSRLGSTFKAGFNVQGWVQCSMRQTLSILNTSECNSDLYVVFKSVRMTAITIDVNRHRTGDATEFIGPRVWHDGNR